MSISSDGILVEVHLDALTRATQVLGKLSTTCCTNQLLAGIRISELPLIVKVCHQRGSAGVEWFHVIVTGVFILNHSDHHGTRGAETFTDQS